MWRWTLGVAAGAVALLATPGGPEAGQSVPIVLAGTVVFVHDGDTVEVRLGGRVERVRYIGVDAPERGHPAGAPATRVNAALVAGRAVRLELDAQARDRYGRLLAYVWAGGVMVNAELVRRGYARALPMAPNLRHARLFAALESQARAHRRGLWSGDSRGAGPASEDVSYGHAPSPTEGRLWRSTRNSRSTPSIGCSRARSSCRGSRRWCACPSISTVPTSAAGFAPRP